MLVPPTANNGGSSSGSSNVGTVQSNRHRRLSSLNTVSWPNPNDLTVKPRTRRMSTVASSDAACQENEVNCELFNIADSSAYVYKNMQDMKERSLASPREKSPRRKSSFSMSLPQDDFTLDPATSRRRSSYIHSWAVDDEDDEGLTTTRAGRRRKYSWGPVGEAGFRDSIRSASSRSPVSHHECKFNSQST